MNNSELFEKLVSLKTDTITANFSDDGGAIERDARTYRNAIESQDVFSDEEISAETTKRWNAMIAKMNEEYKKRNEK